MDSFTSPSKTDMTKLITKSSNAFSELDPDSILLIKDYLNVLSAPTTKKVNLSLGSGSVLI